jgi:tyrosyl-tRNA synthetase
MKITSKHITDQVKIDEVLSRGVAEVLPDKKTLSELMAKKRIRIYLGIDPTGPLLTLGHSVVLRKLQQLADLGHEVILLIGNGTVRIGDPTGKDATRPELTDDQIRQNFSDWKKQASKVLDFDKIEIRYNGDWLDKLTMPDMVKLMAKTTVQQLMERDMFQKRLEEGKPVHGHELIYPLLQGYDSVAMDVDLEIGGTDQTFNMMMGRTLQKSYNDREKWVLATPLINGTDGRKMSKSLNNYIALTDEPKQMFGKLMSVADEMIIDYLTLCTDISLNEIEDMRSAMENQGENPMKYKKILAFTITEMYHDTASSQEAADHFQSTVQEGNIPEEIPDVEIDMKAFDKGEVLTVLDLTKKCLPQESSSNLRRLIEQGAVELIQQIDDPSLKQEEGEKPSDPHQQLESINFDTVRIGKRRYFNVLKRF